MARSREIVPGAGLAGVVALLLRYRSALRRARADGEQQFRGLIEAAPFGIVVFDREQVRYLNGRGRQVLGLPAEVLPGREACGDLLTAPVTAPGRRRRRRRGEYQDPDRRRQDPRSAGHLHGKRIRSSSGPSHLLP
ncbi:MAG: PAS domain-containing protein [bacterium]|nr:PAS domain-containing protein [bacterium]